MENQEEEKIHTADVLVAENHLFSKFMLSDKLLKSLSEKKFFRPSPIQLKICPLSRSRLDMIIQSKSGTGKTLAFSICLLETYDEDLKFPQSVIVVPTREIAVQIANILDELGRHMKNFKACEFIGGTDIKNDRKRIQNSKIVVGTPGRILHLIKNDVFNTTNIKAIVLDEADKLLESGQMAKDVQAIIKTVINNSNVQIIAATATVTKQFESQIKRYMKNPIGITPKHEVPVLLGIKQFVIELREEKENIQLMRNKIAELEKIFARVTFKQCLLFTDSQSKTESYGNYLSKAGWKNEIINGSQEQAERLKVLNKLVKFKCRILITTDLMARGIDIENINLIINLDLPYDCFTYLHRIGRAGRFGTFGLAITFLNGDKDKEKFTKMMNEIGSNESMIYKFPSENVDYNFWNFSDKSQDENLSIINDQNGNVVDYAHEKINNDEIIDENLMLLEITKKLIDNSDENQSKLFDAEALLEEYERSLNEEVPKENDELKLNGNSNDIDKSKLTVKSSEVNGESEPTEIFSTILKTSKSKKDKSSDEYRHVIFVRQPQDDDEESLGSDNETDSDQSKIDSDQSENDDEEEDEEEEIQSEDDEKGEIQSEDSDEGEIQSEDEIQEQNQQDTAENQSFEMYNRYVAHNYNRWRNTFYFQLANIQNYFNSLK